MSQGNNTNSQIYESLSQREYPFLQGLLQKEKQLLCTQYHHWTRSTYLLLPVFSTKDKLYFKEDSLIQQTT